ncbi:HEPN domain-containing protein [Lacibacter luteus]|uniref:HEPN domain-containing protein n=1 Tax=Lacibacter luteus TaxID=2508719 RepID=A0A4V1M7N8_9BACT|nr:HEPN domain-containing protein [Lacibacter luteus]RXK60725.1 HEPN domain-containing protein [Lacibacter luteus]
MNSLINLIEYGNPALISRNLRKVLFDYMESEFRIGITSYFEELLPELNQLFNVLDEAAAINREQLNLISKQYNLLDEEQCAASVFQNELLYRVVSFLVTTLQPERIYSTAHNKMKEDQSHTGLLIIMPDSFQDKPFSEYENFLEGGCSLGTQLCFSLHKASHVKAALAAGHPFYSFACTNNNLLYWSKEEKWPVNTEEKLKELTQTAVQKFNHNFNKAATFLQYAGQGLKEQNNLSAFFIQQAAELCCRAILTALTGHDKKTHALSVLKKSCSRCTSIVDHVFPADTEEEKRLLQIIDDAYIDARYKTDYSVHEPDLQLLFNKVQQLHNAAVPEIQNRLGLPV